MKEQQDKLNAYASMNTKNIQKKANISSRVDNSEVSADSYSEVKEAKPGSMMAKANMVRDYSPARRTLLRCLLSDLCIGCIRPIQYDLWKFYLYFIHRSHFLPPPSSVSA